jgi:hypothetical protein
LTRAFGQLNIEHGSPCDSCRCISSELRILGRFPEVENNISAEYEAGTTIGNEKRPDCEISTYCEVVHFIAELNSLARQPLSDKNEIGSTQSLKAPNLPLKAGKPEGR